MFEFGIVRVGINGSTVLRTGLPAVLMRRALPDHPTLVWVRSWTVYFRDGKNMEVPGRV